MNRQGFTLVELMIGVVIVSLLVYFMAYFFSHQNKAVQKEMTMTNIRQNVRALTIIMSKELSLAGYDPKGIGFTKIPYSKDSLIIYADVNNDSDLNDQFEQILYYYRQTDSAVIRVEGAFAEIAAKNVVQFSLSYKKENDSLVVSNEDADEIRKIVITITGQSPIRDPNYSENQGFRTFSLPITVFPKNLSY